MSHDQQAQRLREIDDLLAECQRHDMTGVRVSYAQLRALRDATGELDALRWGNEEGNALIATLRADKQALEMHNALLEQELDALRKQEPACVIDVNRHGDGVLVAGSLERGIHKLYAAPVPPAAVAEVPDVDSVRQAVARAWCNPTNSSKEMDVDLAEAAVAEVMNLLSATPAPVAQKVPDGVVLPDHEPTIAIGEILDGYDGDDREDVWDSIKAYADLHARAALEAASIPVLNEAPSLWVAFSDSGANIRMWSAEGPEKISDAGLTPIRFVLASAQAQGEGK